MTIEERIICERFSITDLETNKLIEISPRQLIELLIVYKAGLLNIDEYLIDVKIGTDNLQINICECCGKEFETNLNRIRCSKKCARKMKNKRHKHNAVARNNQIK